MKKEALRRCHAFSTTWFKNLTEKKKAAYDKCVTLLLKRYKMIFLVFENISDKLNSFKRNLLSASIMNFQFSLKAEENSPTGENLEWLFRN